MVANTSPIFTLTPVSTFTQSIATANTAKDGTGTAPTIFTAGADGGYVTSIVARALGTNTATVLRVFLNNGSTAATASNNSLIAEMTLAATTLSETSATAHYELPINKQIAAGYKLNITLGTTVAAGYSVTAFGGSY
jgi:hypothetical protein